MRKATKARDHVAVPDREVEELLKHPALVRVLNTVGRVAGTDASVLILGESGTGKELIANALHRNSPRADGPLVTVNAGGIPESLFDSEMFGHVRGAFTDAKSDRKGRFELADGGTIFLDEVGELGAQSQVKLLRVLQDRSFQPVGSAQTRHTNVRVVAATNRDLTNMVQDGTFREDLLYRLNLITIRLPPLRERVSDILRIAVRHLRQVSAYYDLEDIGLTEPACRWLESREWQGNVRELTQTLERAVLVSGEQLLDTVHLMGPDLADDMPPARDLLSAVDHLTLNDLERLMIEKCLDRNDNNISRTATALGLSRAALYRRMEKHGLAISDQ